MAGLDPKTFRGTLVAVPIVNVLGFMTGDRYLPDRRDLNRSFPGSPRGSLASRIAHLFMREIVAGCEVGIDLHTGSDRRSNLPQIRADLDDALTRELAEAFAAPVMLHAGIRDGSLRHAAREQGRRCCSTKPARACASTPTPSRGRDRRTPGAGRAQMTEPVDEPAVEPSLECRASGWVRARRTESCTSTRTSDSRSARGAARYPVRLLRQDPASGVRQPRRQGDRAHRAAAGQLR